MENAQQNNNQPAKQENSNNRHRRGGRRRGKNPNAANRNPNAQKFEKPAQNAAAQNTAVQKPQPVKAEVVEEDSGLELISRRAPAQKYANFEEYMKAHE